MNAVTLQLECSGALHMGLLVLMYRIERRVWMEKERFRFVSIKIRMSKSMG